MKPDTAALQLVLQHAEAERDAALAHLTQLADARTRMRSQQEQLQGYRRDYHARWTAQFRQSGAAEVVQHYQGFVDRLNQALDQLDLQLAMLDRQTEQARERLMERETKVMAVRRLIERRDEAFARRVARREQSHTDEVAARIAALRPATLDLALSA